MLMINGWQQISNSIIFKAGFPGDTACDDDDYEDAESEAACTDDEPVEDEEVEDTKLPGSFSR